VVIYSLSKCSLLWHLSFEAHPIHKRGLVKERKFSWSGLSALYFVASSTFFLILTSFSLIVCSLCFVLFFYIVANLSSGESSKPHSPKKAFLIGELKDAKRIIAQREEEIRQMEARLQRLEMDHERPHHNNRARRHHHHHRHTSRSSQSFHGNDEEDDWRMHHEDRHQNMAKPYFPYVKLPLQKKCVKNGGSNVAVINNRHKFQHNTSFH